MSSVLILLDLKYQNNNFRLKNNTYLIEKTDVLQPLGLAMADPESVALMEVIFELLVLTYPIGEELL